MGKTSHFLALDVNISKTVRDTSIVTIVTNRKLHTSFRLTPRSMTLYDPELLSGQTLSKFRVISRFGPGEATTAKQMKIDLNVSDRIVAH